MLRVTLSTVLQARADWVWGQLHNAEAFDYITGWMLEAEPVDFDPAQTEILAREGQVLHLKVRILGLPTTMAYEIKVAHLDERGRQVLTHERGGMIRRWHHRISVRPLELQICWYQDQIDIDAGPLTPLVWAYAHVFYRYRQHRWRQLALAAKTVTPIV